jgi:hypothetical protein
VTTALELLSKNIQYALDVCGVVLGDPHKMGTSAQSAAAMKMLYLPMINTCDMLRTQYGNRFLVPLLTGMLKAAKKIGTRAGGEILTTSDGRRLQVQPAVMLPPRLIVERQPGEAPPRRNPEELDPPKLPKAGEVKTRTEPRKPGASENLTLKWPPYFRPTAQDLNQTVEAINKAKGQLCSEETAVKYTATMLSVKDVAEELTAIQAEKALNAAMYPGPEMLNPPGLEGGNGPKTPQGDDDDE